MIVWFSGNGNSRYVARMLAERLGENKLMRLDRGLLDKGCIDLSGEARLVWVCPVYAWGLPPVVERFMRSVKLERGEVEHYLVVTCGDDTGNIDKQWRAIMNKRGAKAMGCWSVIMPNTYVTMKGFDVDSTQLATEKLNAAPARVNVIADAISFHSEVTDIERGSWAWLKSGIVKAWFQRFAMSPKGFHVTDDCVACGKCVSQCPMENVKMTEKRSNGKVVMRPSWGNDCAFCMGCYNVCPASAVHYGRSTRGKGRYICTERG